MHRSPALLAALGVAAALLQTAVPAYGAPQVAVRPLPKPVTAGGMPLNEALAKRRSCRSFADTPVTLQQLSQICWAAQGVTEMVKGLRTAPAAMALYAVRLFVVDRTGLAEYLPKEHALRTAREGDLLPAARALALNPATSGEPPVVLLLCVDLAALQARAGAKSERFALLEAGHVAQNILLQVTALGLVSVPVGGVDEAKAGEALKLPDGVRAVYAMPVGKAKPVP
ncbi:MAG: SagB/ThcOx family dehydrogenase [Armatimonadetes bacterium]|nr:SagB/ThcOx family dehydrogenase [Armatimonadota bacterium]